MAAGDLQNNLLSRVAAIRGVGNLSGTTDPTITQVIAWLNEGVRRTQRALLPRKLSTGVWSPGNLSKLLGTLTSDSETGGSGFARLPQATIDTGPAIAIFQAVLIGLYPAKEVPLGELWDRRSGYALPDAAKPIFAFGSNETYPGIFYLPADGTPTVTYYYVNQPLAMEYDTQENFLLNDDLLPLVANYAIARMWLSNNRSKALGDLFMKIYEAGIAALVGESQNTVELRSP